MALKGMEPAAS